MQVNRRAFVAGGAILASVASTSHASTKKSGGGRAEAKALSSLEDYIDDHRADWGIPGMTACVVDRNGFTGTIMSGLADVDRRKKVGPDHLFQIGSITKMMTALAVWSLIDEGKLSLDARLKDLMPGLVIRDGDKITLKHLLDHTSGLPSGAPLIMDDGLWTEFKPGTKWSYCNLGYRIAGKIAAQADGRPFPECVEARVLRPLGMMQSIGAMRVADRSNYAQGYEPARMDRPVMRPGPMTAAPWVDYDGASGCIASTASEMALFLRFLLALADGKGGPVFSDEIAKQFLAQPADAPGWSEGTKYGNGIAHIELEDRNYLHHTGGMVSFSSSLHVDLEAGVAAFASGNVHYALNYRPRDVTIYACELLRAAHEDAERPTPKLTKPKVEKPEKYAGRFTAESGAAFEIVAAGDKLTMRQNGYDTEMRPIGDDSFACSDEAYQTTGLQFEMEDDAVMRAWAGDVEFLQNPSGGFLPKASPELQALAGRYDSDDRWKLPVWVYARNGKLCMRRVNYVSILTPMDGGDWRVGEGGTWARFDGVLGEKPQRLNISGTLYFRRFS
ncbi:MAG: beta-lactamase family protein [Alphaproteobacteria bacterium]|nr:beta-lactamase family protein [Alphaproteobacteria bacterium]